MIKGNSKNTIMPDSPKGLEFGFTSDKYRGYLWDSGDKSIMISFIQVLDERKGHLKQLFNNILSRGYDVRVPTPIGLMSVLVKNWGFTHTVEQDPLFGACEVWVKEGGETIESVTTQTEEAQA